jgi:hypothetical protein
MLWSILASGVVSRRNVEQNTDSMPKQGKAFSEKIGF